MIQFPRSLRVMPASHIDQMHRLGESFDQMLGLREIAYRRLRHKYGFEGERLTVQEWMAFDIHAATGGLKNALNGMDALAEEMIERELDAFNDKCDVDLDDDDEGEEWKNA